MTSPGLSFRLALVAATLLVAGSAMASDRGLAGGVHVSRPGLPLDPELLPPNTAPGDCVTRRVTGPGGAYRWDRVECDADRGVGGPQPWGYGHRPLAVETGYGAGGAYGERRDFDRPDDRYGPPPSRWVEYRYAGRDANGYLVWPGKRP
jgi:hypothetical protein